MSTWRIQATKKGDFPVSVEKRPLGKYVTVISNVRKDAQSLLDQLKRSLGAGGTYNNLRASIEVQGRHDERIRNFLVKNCNNVSGLAKIHKPQVDVKIHKAESTGSGKVRIKPRWKKSKHDEGQTFCSSPQCTWKYCTSMIHGRCADSEADNDSFKIWGNEGLNSVTVFEKHNGTGDDTKRKTSSEQIERGLDSLYMVASSANVKLVKGFSSHKGKVNARQRKRVDILDKQKAIKINSEKVTAKAGRVTGSTKKTRKSSTNWNPSIKGSKMWDEDELFLHDDDFDDDDLYEDYHFESGNNPIYLHSATNASEENVRKTEAGVIGTSCKSIPSVYDWDDATVLTYITEKKWKSKFGTLITAVLGEGVIFPWRTLIAECQIGAAVEDAFLSTLEGVLDSRIEPTVNTCEPEVLYQNEGSRYNSDTSLKTTNRPQWRCNSCSLVNPGTVDFCTVCNSKRSDSSSSSANQSQEKEIDSYATSTPSLLWRCRNCSAINQFTNCGVCGRSKPDAEYESMDMSSAVESVTDTGWTCEVCTLNNSNPLSDVCAACDNPRPENWTKSELNHEDGIEAQYEQSEPPSHDSAVDDDINESKVKLLAMGFQISEVERCLAMSNGCFTAAMELLLAGI